VPRFRRSFLTDRLPTEQKASSQYLTTAEGSWTRLVRRKKRGLMSDATFADSTWDERRWLVLGVIALAQLMVVLDKTPTTVKPWGFSAHARGRAPALVRRAPSIPRPAVGEHAGNPANRKPGACHVILPPLDNRPRTR
jgi:hypothetical protein